MSNQRPRKVRMGSSRRQLDRTSLLAHDVTSEIQTDPRSMTAVDMDSVNPNYSEHGNQLDFKEPISETSEGLAFASKKCGNLIHPPTTFEIDAHTNQSRRVSPKPSQPQKEDMSGNRNENVVMIWSNDLTREQCKEFSENKESQMGMPHESCQKTTLQMSKPTWDDNMTPEVSQCSGVSWHPRLNSSLYSSPCQPLTDDLTNSPQQSSDSIIHKEVEREIRKEDSNNLAVSSTGTIAEGQEYLLQVGGICGDVPSLMKKEHEVSHDLNPLLKQSEHPTQSVVCPLLIEVPNQEEAEQEQITYTTPDSLDSTGNSVIVVESQPLLTMQYTVNPGNNQEMTIQDHLENTKRDHIFDLSELGHNMKEKSFSRVCESEQNSDGAAVDASGLDNDVERTEVASNQEQDGDLDMKSSRKKRRMGSSRRIGNQGKGGGGDHSGEIVESDFSTDFNKTNNDFETELKVEMKCDAESLEGGTLGTSTDKVDCLWLIPPQSEIKERGSEDIIERARKEIYTGGNIHLSPDISHGDVDKRKEDESEEKGEIVEKMEVIKIPLSKTLAEENNQEITERLSRPYHEENLCRVATEPQEKDISPPGAVFDAEKNCSQECESEGHVNNKPWELIEDTPREEGEGHTIKVEALLSEYSSASADVEYDLTFPTRSGNISFNDGTVDNLTKLPITELMEPEKNQSANDFFFTLDSKIELKHRYNNDSNITSEFNPQSEDVEPISSNVTLSDSHSIDDLAVESCLSTNMREINPLATVPQHVPSNMFLKMFAPTSSQLQDDSEQVGALNENKNPVEMPEVENDFQQNSDGAAVDASGLDNDVERTEVASNQEQDGDLDMKSSRKKRRMGSSRRIGNQGKGGGGDHSGEIVESDFSTDFNKTNNDFETELKVEMKCDAESLEGGTLGTSTDKVDCLWLIPPQSEIKERGSEDIIERACKEIYTGGNIHLSPDISHGDVDKRKEDESEEKNEIVEKISRPYHEEDLCRSATDPQDKDIRPPGADFLMVDQNSLSKENAPHSLDINSSILFAPVSDIRDNDDKMDTAGQHQTALSSNVDRISGQGNHGSLPHVKDDDNQILRRRKMGSSRWTKGSATGSQKGSKKAHTTEDKEIEKDAVLSENISEGDPQKRILKDNEGPEKVVTAEEEANQIGGDTHQSMSEAPNIVRRKLGSNNMTGRMTPIQENTKERKEVESEVSEDRKIFKDELKMKVNKDKSTEQNGERSSENGVKPVNTTVSALPIELSNDLHVEGRRRKLGSQRKSRRQHHHDYPPESKDHGASRQISGDATLTFDTLNKCDRRANCFNVVMVGSSNVGKTSFMKRIQSGSFSPDFSASIGIDTCIHALPVDGREVMLQIWDTAGQERFHSISKQIFHKGQAFLLMYDITSSVSFTDVRYWISCIQESAGEEVIMLLLGNKSDCAGRKVTPSEGKLLAKEYNIDFNECSAATGEHIVSSIESLARKLTENYHKIEEDVVLQQQQQKKRCC